MITPFAKLRKELAKKKLDAILISSASNITYLTNYSGFSKEEREAYLFITKKFQYILTDGRYSQAIKTSIPDFELIEISSKNSVKEILKYLKTKHEIKKLGFEGHNISFLEHKKLLQRFDYSKHQSLHSLRIIKTSDEISKIENACKLGDKTFTYILKKIKLGISEKELANEIEFFIKKAGSDISFPPIVAFGKNSAIPHHQTSDKRLATSDQLVLLDFGVKLNNYCSDMTRTIFFGKPTREQKKMYQTVLEAQEKAIDFLSQCYSELVSESQTKTRSQNKFGMTGKNIDRIARDYIIFKGYQTIPHSLGHGIGIDVHEAPHLSPKSKDVLKEGMVFSIEPGIYVPQLGGVRIEDLVFLRKNKIRLLTHSPKTIIEL